MKYQIAQFSTVGARAVNEDRVGIAERKNAVLLAVADGLGGHSGGELAAQTVVDTVTRLFRGVRQTRLADPFAFLVLTLLKAHHAVIARAQAHVPPLEARTTCVVCMVQEGYAYWAHVGDSRLYHFRGARLLKRTEDHTTIEELRRDGVINEAEMAQHPGKSYLLQSLGGGGEPRISLGEETALARGDTLLLCTDGLWEGLSAEEIAGFLAVPKLEDGLDEMLHTAETRMGPTCDNVTVACLRWEDRTATGLPLRGPIAAQVDPDLVWRKAAARVAAKRRATEAEPASGDQRETIAERIQALEDYLRQFEPKG